jgi:phage nucleotide-binding protein
MKVIKAESLELPASTILIYCPAGGGKTTALGKIADKIAKETGKKSLLLEVDRTSRVLKGNKNIDIAYVDNIETWTDWESKLKELMELKESGKLKYGAVFVDNVSELERCILSDLGRKGKNKGVPAQADYQYMQFKLVNSLRYIKSLEVVCVWTAWETIEQFIQPDGSSYSRKYPKINGKIVDNICGLCDVVANLIIKSDGTRGFILEAMQNVYAKNQIDDRKGCIVEEIVQ